MEPAVVVNAADSPPAAARVERTPGRPACLWVSLGRIMFDLRDREVVLSTGAAFRRASHLASTTFLSAAQVSVREQAAEAVNRLFAPPPGSGLRPTISRTPPAWRDASVVPTRPAMVFQVSVEQVR